MFAGNCSTIPSLTPSAILGLSAVSFSALKLNCFVKLYIVSPDLTVYPKVLGFEGFKVLGVALFEGVFEVLVFRLFLGLGFWGFGVLGVAELGVLGCIFRIVPVARLSLICGFCCSNSATVRPY